MQTCIIKINSTARQFIYISAKSSSWFLFLHTLFQSKKVAAIGFLYHSKSLWDSLSLSLSIQMLASHCILRLGIIFNFCSIDPQKKLAMELSRLFSLITNSSLIVLSIAISSSLCISPLFVCNTLFLWAHILWSTSQTFRISLLTQTDSIVFFLIDCKCRFCSSD